MFPDDEISLQEWDEFWRRERHKDVLRRHCMTMTMTMTMTVMTAIGAPPP